MEAILTIVVLIFSIIVHEVAHGYAAYALGDPTAKLAGRLTLNPIPHIDPVGSILVPLIGVLSPTNFFFGWAKPVPYNPYNLKNQRWGEALVAVAGPATNILLALVFAGVTRIAYMNDLSAAASFAATICFVNLFLGLFNLIPFPPLDGFTVLRGLLPYKWAYGFRNFENHIQSWGVGGIFLFLIVFSFFLTAPFFLLTSFLFGLLVG